MVDGGDGPRPTVRPQLSTAMDRFFFVFVFVFVLVFVLVFVIVLVLVFVLVFAFAFVFDGPLPSVRPQLSTAMDRFVFVPVIVFVKNVLV